MKIYIFKFGNGKYLKWKVFIILFFLKENGYVEIVLYGKVRVCYLRECIDGLKL